MPQEWTAEVVAQMHMAKITTKHLAKEAQEQPAAELAQEPSAGSAESKAKAGGPPSGFYIYVGPNIAGLIQSNKTYRGDRASVLASLQKAIERYPLIKTLIIPGDSLPMARPKLKTAGNALHANYVKLAEQVKADYAKKNKNQ